jgi:peptide/nickel transport system substrate-binding protein
MSPSMLGYNASLEQYANTKFAYNVNQAKSLLQQAGWVDVDGDGVLEKDGKELTLELLVPYDVPSFKKIGPLLQAQLAAIGIKIDLKEFETYYIGRRIRAWDFDLACVRYSWHDPAGLLPYVLHSTIGNRTYSNPEVDRLFEIDRSTALSEVERAKLYTELQLILLEDAPWVNLFVQKEYTAVSKNVKGLIVMPPFSSMYINDVKIEKEVKK